MRTFIVQALFNDVQEAQKVTTNNIGEAIAFCDYPIETIQSVVEITDEENADVRLDNRRPDKPEQVCGETGSDSIIHTVTSHVFTKYNSEANTVH